MSGAEEEEDIEQKPTYVELFSDLMFVVAMHLVAEPLEEMESFMSMELPLYLLRVFSIWWMWQSAMAWSNMCRLVGKCGPPQMPVASTSYRRSPSCHEEMP